MFYLGSGKYIIATHPDQLHQVIWAERPLCPCCSKPLCSNGTRIRWLTTFDGYDFKKEGYLLPRWRCYACHKIHIALPADLFFFRRRLHVGLCEQIYEGAADSVANFLDEKTVVDIQQAVERVYTGYSMEYGAECATRIRLLPGWLANMLAVTGCDTFPPLYH